MRLPARARRGRPELVVSARAPSLHGVRPAARATRPLILTLFDGLWTVGVAAPEVYEISSYGLAAAELTSACHGCNVTEQMYHLSYELRR